MKNTNKMKTMKSIYVLAALLGLQLNTMFAAGNFIEAPAPASNTSSVVATSALAPVIPAEVTFEDASAIAENMPAAAILAPVIPLAADFGDETPAAEISISSLAPVTPLSADLDNDHGTNGNINLVKLAPNHSAGCPDRGLRITLNIFSLHCVVNVKARFRGLFYYCIPSGLNAPIRCKTHEEPRNNRYSSHRRNHHTLHRGYWYDSAQPTFRCLSRAG